ncbi:uncharacterized protein LOC108671939 [Hyalella azteca]|uniref:Uncharacterized protein LOC108671939 n=1 Tax=Hyalella azteca TaxID=294128 RepID=A0A8B7NMW4_HYAAZ|nr:uncharacterized protein LOC108671939 [Hyalella azteca]
MLGTLSKMACYQSKQAVVMPVLLGFVDEEVYQKNQYTTNHKVSKIGGKPDWPTLAGCTSPVCSGCGAVQALIMQIYAPLHFCPDHRTLYIFACLTPSCWGASHSWTCIRVQWPASPVPESSGHKSSSRSQACEEDSGDMFEVADDWGSDSEDDSNANVDYPVTENANLNQLMNINEPVVNVVQQKNFAADQAYEAGNLNNRNIFVANVAEMDEESQALGLDRLNLNQGNGNGSGIAVRGASGGGLTGEGRGGEVDEGEGGEEATALIEGSEDDMVAVDSPELPSQDISLWFKAPAASRVSSTCDSLREFFLCCEEEVLPKGAALLLGHEQELLHRYNAQTPRGSGVGGGDDEGSDGRYVKSVPAHGDVYMQKFQKRVAHAPHQVLRYCRHSSSGPLLLRPFTGLEGSTCCPHCGSPLIFELQVMPQLIPHLLPRPALSTTSAAPASTTLNITETFNKTSIKSPQNVNINDTKDTSASTRSKNSATKSKMYSSNRQSLESVNSIDLQDLADSAGVEKSPKLRSKRNKNIIQDEASMDATVAAKKSSSPADVNAGTCNVLLSGVVEYGTVLVFTCSQSCWHGKPVLETTHVQPEVI